ncbi:MAG: hypothetical protein Q3972_01945 [Corynebacterium sp.]|nr:hypothetical protein [Corynebacterium sp.]
MCDKSNFRDGSDKLPDLVVFQLASASSHLGGYLYDDEPVVPKRPPIPVENYPDDDPLYMPLPNI